MAPDEDPLIKALPPATDYFTYLTIVEYNLTAEKLPTLHSILQDTTLTTNIGWDLVHLLLPLLPASEQCLHDVARLGNPREVLLKINEALAALDWESCGEDDAHSEELEVMGQDEVVYPQGEPRDGSPGYAGVVDTIDQNSNIEARQGNDLPLLQFIVLLDMLSTTQTRIKTKVPSRFLSSTLQAVLTTYLRAQSHIEKLTVATLGFIKTLSGIKRPLLPPRVSSSQVLKTLTVEGAPDPEKHDEPPTADEATLAQRLLQSFLTHILEHYMVTLPLSDEVPGLAWASRLQEKWHPERTVPGRETFTNRFVSEHQYQTRSMVVGEILAQARDLGFDSDDLFRTFTTCATDKVVERLEGEEEPPLSSNDVPLSKLGSLFLYAAGNMAHAMYDAPPTTPDLPIFPEHARLLRSFLGSFPAQPGPLHSTTADTLLTLALLAVDDNNLGEPSDEEEFTQYLQMLSILSAELPIPSLRYHAHSLISTVLRSHPSDVVRLAFIHDTLEHCPYDNIKACAVGWLKDEIIQANPAPSFTEIDNPNPSVFGTPVALDTLSPFLFPDLTVDLEGPSLSECWLVFKQKSNFYRATLSFYYFLLSAQHVRQALNIRALHANKDVGRSYLHPLRRASERFKEGLKQGNLAADEGPEDVEAALSELRLIDFALDRVIEGTAELNKV